MHIWELPEWPRFIWDGHALVALLARVARAQGRLLGRLEALGAEFRAEMTLATLTEDIISSGGMEGDTLEHEQVRAVTALRLGLPASRHAPLSRHAEGLVEMVVDAAAHCAKPLTRQRLFSWHAALFPTGFSGSTRIVAGNWRDSRDDPRQALPAEQVSAEMIRFLRWFEDPRGMDPLLASGLAHLWFSLIRPFADGNGPCARALADMALARSDPAGQRFFSMSSQISREIDDYHARLEQARTGTLDITRWQEWFLECALRAIDGTQDTLGTTLTKAKFWERFAKDPLSKRQIIGLGHLVNGSVEQVTTSTWATRTDCSQDTAHRDILDLVARGVLRRGQGAGRSTSYSLAR